MSLNPIQLMYDFYAQGDEKSPNGYILSVPANAGTLTLEQLLAMYRNATSRIGVDRISYPSVYQRGFDFFVSQSRAIEQEITLKTAAEAVEKARIAAEALTAEKARIAREEALAVEKLKPLPTNTQPSNITLSEPVKTVVSPAVVSSIVLNAFLVHPLTKLLQQKNSLNGYGDILSTIWNAAKSLVTSGTRSITGVVTTGIRTSASSPIVRGTTSTVTRAVAPVVAPIVAVAAPVVKTVAPIVTPIINPIIDSGVTVLQALTGTTPKPSTAAPTEQAAQVQYVDTVVPDLTSASVSTLPTNVQGLSLDHPMTKIIPKG